jgi:hypothetical protein
MRRAALPQWLLCSVLAMVHLPLVDRKLPPPSEAEEMGVWYSIAAGLGVEFTTLPTKHS